MNDNCVIFKGKKDGLLIILDDNIDFSILKVAFAKKVIEAKQFFGSTTTGVTFQGRRLSASEEQELLDIVATRSNLRVSHVEKISKKRLEAPTMMELLPPKGERCLFHKSSLRNGQNISYPGSIVIVGDVNPGGEVIAEGNVIVLGSLKGMVHAGCGGDMDSFVMAMNLSPVQLRISDIISYIPPEISKKNKNKPQPSYAYIQNGQIYIAQL